MTTKEVYVACDGIEFYDEDKYRKYEDELDNLKVIASNKAILSSYTCDRCPLTSICDSCFNEHPHC